MPYQGRLLRLLKASDDFIIFPSDKNLGPVILERAEYIRRAHIDHLSDSRTYKQLTETEAADRISTIKGLLSDFLDNDMSTLDYHDRVYLERSSHVADPYPLLLHDRKSSQNTLAHSTYCLGLWQPPTWARTLG
jgi:hypothetical protein